jgi:hypothetical protein
VLPVVDLESLEKIRLFCPYREMNSGSLILTIRRNSRREKSIFHRENTVSTETSGEGIQDENRRAALYLNTFHRQFERTSPEMPVLVGTCQ